MTTVLQRLDLAIQRMSNIGDGDLESARLYSLGNLEYSRNLYIKGYEPTPVDMSAVLTPFAEKICTLVKIKFGGRL